MRKISQVTQQKYSSDCVLACIAMISDYSLEKLRRVFPVYNGIDLFYEQAILNKLGITFIAYHHPQVYNGRVYFLTVPSLNTSCHSHRIICDTRYENPVIFDPNKGNGLKYYGDGGFKIQSYSEVVEFPDFSDFILIED